MATPFEEKDYSDLEGKEIIYFDGIKEIPAIVIGCDYNIGITIVEKENPDHYLYCLIGPSAPNFKNFPSAMKEHNWLFFLRIKAIKKGYVDEEKIYNYKQKAKTGLSFTGPDASSCPFNQ